MRTAESWVSVISPAAHLGVDGELERQIKRIQLDALLEAAELARSAEEKESKELGMGAPVIAGSEAILARAEEVEAK